MTKPVMLRFSTIAEAQAEIDRLMSSIDNIVTSMEDLGPDGDVWAFARQLRALIERAPKAT